MARKNKSTCAQALEAIKAKSFFNFQNNYHTRISTEIFFSESLSLRAKAVLLYLHSRPEGWSPRVYDIKKKFKFKDRAWATVRQNLEENNFIKVVSSTTGKAGKSLELINSIEGNVYLKAPKYLIDSNLSSEAIICAIYCMYRTSFKSTWEIRVNNIKSELGVSDRVWRRTSIELRQSGFLQEKKQKENELVKSTLVISPLCRGISYSKGSGVKSTPAKRTDCPQSIPAKRHPPLTQSMHTFRTDIDSFNFIIYSSRILSTSENRKQEISQDSKPRGKYNNMKLPPPLHAATQEERNVLNKKIKNHLKNLCAYFARTCNKPNFEQDLKGVIESNNLTDRLDYVTFLLGKIKINKKIISPIGALIDMLRHPPEGYVQAFEHSFVNELFDYELRWKKLKAENRNRYIPGEINKRLSDIVNENIDLIHEHMQKQGFAIDEYTNDYLINRGYAVAELLTETMMQDKVVNDLYSEMRYNAQIIGQETQTLLQMINPIAELKKQREQAEIQSQYITEAKALQLFIEVRSELVNKLNLGSRKIDSKKMYRYLGKEKNAYEVIEDKSYECIENIKLNKKLDLLAFKYYAKKYPSYPKPNVKLDLDVEIFDLEAKLEMEDFVDGHPVIKIDELEAKRQAQEKDDFVRSRNEKALRMREEMEAAGLIPQHTQRKIVVNGDAFAGLLD